MKRTTYKKARFVFWDIESLTNVFTVAFFDRETRALNVFYLVDVGTPVGDALRRRDLDHDTVLAAILKRNPAWARLWKHSETPILRLHNLAKWEANHLLARMIGLSDAASVNDPHSQSTYLREYRPVCDTDPNYDPEVHPFVCGYNSANYDTTLMSIYLASVMESTQEPVRQARERAMLATTDDEKRRIYEEMMETCKLAFRRTTPVTAAEIRRHNDALFTDEYIRQMPSYLTSSAVANGKGWDGTANKVRRSMLHSGRHLDIARFNEKQQRVGLKRLLGMLGYQILESDRLKHDSIIETIDDLIELIAYNVSDVVNLAYLADHPTYSGGFDLKHALMVDYPETVYQAVSGSKSKPDCKPDRVRRDRLTPDSTSAKFVARVLAPYERLKDIKTVSFMYPSKQRAQELGIEQFDVLELAKSFFYENVDSAHARAAFDEVYEYYASIRGKNFNGSKAYVEDYGLDPDCNNVDTDGVIGAYRLNEIPKRATNVPYFRADGAPTSCFATFSTGGIHGAEANMVLFKDHNAEANALRDLIDAVIDTLHVRDLAEPEQALAIRKSIRVTLPDERVIPWQQVLMSKSSPKPERGAFFKPVRNKELFIKRSDGSTKLDPKYAMTSVAKAVHEDFSSYYPLLLTNLSAFYNEALGEDRYGKLYLDKERFGQLMKDPSITADERDMFVSKRSGVKLLLNSASGAGDTEFEGSPIRMNNMIISMRLIGQLFSWMIGQAQTLEGARIISTNTDGLYSADIDLETNNRVLDEQSERIHVLIEPEELLLVSKDSNNRIELAVPPAYADGTAKPQDAKILSASGSSLACWRKPSPTNSLAHPAALDRAMAVYLRAIAVTNPELINKPVDPDTARDIMTAIAHQEDSVEALLLFQNVIAASPGMLTFHYAADPIPVDQEDSPELAARNPRALQHYNRVFVVKPGTEGAVSLRAAGAWKVNATVAQSRKKRGDASVVRTDATANAIMIANGYAPDAMTAHQYSIQQAPVDQDISVRKITGIEPTWHMMVLNEDLMCLSEDQRRALIEQLDLDTYAQMFCDSYESNWMNTIPEQEPEQE